MNKTFPFVLGIAVVAGGAWLLWGTSTTKDTTPGFENTTYIIEGRRVTLTDGYAEAATVPGSALKTVTRYFGNSATGDLNGDGKPDVGFILTQNSGGSGMFYYAAVALKTAHGYQGTNAVLLGDRVAPQTTEIRNGELIVNYAERKASEPMTTPPSVGVSAYLSVQGTTLTATSSPSQR